MNLTSQLADSLIQHREELRYYADLARFASIYNSLSEPLGLRLPQPIVNRRTDANTSALRAILDLPEDQPTPSWALESGPSRRTGASRVPQPAEVVRMLLAFAERTLGTNKIKSDLESTARETEHRRRHAIATKAENNAWEAKKKKLAAARVQCRSAAETKANKELVSDWMCNAV
jgi:hypothetical protein